MKERQEQEIVVYAVHGDDELLGSERLRRGLGVDGVEAVEVQELEARGRHVRPGYAP